MSCFSELLLSVCGLVLGGQHWGEMGHRSPILVNVPDQVGQVQEPGGVLAGSAAEPSTTGGPQSCEVRPSWTRASSAETCWKPDQGSVLFALRKKEVTLIVEE